MLVSPFQELTTKESQLDTSHTTLRRHHDEVQDLEHKHLQALHRLRTDLHKVQHDRELLNQREYTEKQQKELKKRHMLQTSQLPKSVRVRESILLQLKSAWRF